MLRFSGWQPSDPHGSQRSVWYTCSCLPFMMHERLRGFTLCRFPKRNKGRGSLGLISRVIIEGRGEFRVYFSTNITLGTSYVSCGKAHRPKKAPYLPAVRGGGWGAMPAPPSPGTPAGFRSMPRTYNGGGRNKACKVPPSTNTQRFRVVRVLSISLALLDLRLNLGHLVL